MTEQRTTKYTSAVLAFMQEAHHATNAQILEYLQQAFPDLTATTVHRITSRMVERHELALAPATKDNAARFDSNLSVHDHFQCECCDGLRDIELPQALFNTIQAKLGECKLNGRLVVQGSCARCLEK